MRACFLGQNVCALGYGVATLQSPPLVQDEQTGEFPTDIAGHGQAHPSQPSPADRAAAPESPPRL